MLEGWEPPAATRRPRETDAELVARRGRAPRRREPAGSEPRPVPVLDGDRRADVCIVGGGFTGLWTAMRIKERAPETDVAIVEADICGGGASGRNGGFAMTLVAHFQTLSEPCGSAEALRLARARARRWRRSGRSATARDRRRLPHGGWLWTATNAAQLGRGRDGGGPAPRERAVRSGHRPRSPQRTGSPVHIAGVFEPTSATVQPALLARGLLRVARERGVSIHEGRRWWRSNARRRRSSARRWSLTADRVVLARTPGRPGPRAAPAFVSSRANRDQRAGAGGCRDRLERRRSASRTRA